MQAIILAAGMGRRLGTLTNDNTKCMIKVNGETLIDRLLVQLSSLNLNKVIIVIGYEGNKLKTYLENKYNTLNLEYVENPIYDRTNNIYSLALAKDKLQQDDTLLIESDLIFEDSIFPKIMNHPYPNIALVDKYETWMDGTMVRLDDDDNIVNFIPKKAFKYSDIEFYYKTVNIYKFSKEFSQTHYVPFLEAYTKALGNNEYYEQVLRVITLLDNVDLKALPLSGEKWYEIDDIQDLNNAETIFAQDKEKVNLMNNRYGGYWRFPNLIDFCYLVNPFFPNKRMREELKANFDVLLREYPSGLRINNLLIGKYFGINQDYVCAGNGAAELIKSLMKYLDGKIGVIYPTFEEYPNRRNEQSIISYIPNNTSFSYTKDDIINFFGNKEIKNLLLINPDNPSGNFICKKDVLEILKWCETKNITLVLDESFVDFTEGSIDNTLLKDETLKAHGNLVVIKSISKSYGVPGLRLGVLASSNQELISIVRQDIPIWNINSFAEFYMQIFGKYEKDYAKACSMFIKERTRFEKELQEIIYIKVIPSQANYFLCQLTSKYTSKELTNILLNKYNILIKDCGAKSAFSQSNYVRIAIRDAKDNDKLIHALKTL